MELLSNPWFIALLLAVVAGLDGTAAFQTMVGQPIVMGALIGVVFSNFYAGLFAGLLVQLVWSNELPLGGYVAPDTGVAGFTSALVTASLSHPFFTASGWTLLYGLVVGGLAGWLAVFTTRYIRRFLDRLVPLFDLAAQSGDPSLASRLFIAGPVLFALHGIVVAWLPAWLAAFAWSSLKVDTAIRTLGLIHLDFSALLALGAVSSMRLFVNKGRLIAFSLPLLITGVYLFIASWVSANG